MSTESPTRSYRKTERARQEAETRLRITEATVELHRTLGPANTTVTDVAKLAGVSRMTVYNHFPTLTELFMGCSTHWAASNPFPDPERWAEIDDASERLVSALTELYGWYEQKEDMLGKVFRDVPIVQALSTVMSELWTPYVDGMVGVLAHGWPSTNTEPETLHAALRLAVDFNTWRVLTESGLNHQGAAHLAARMVAGGSGRTI
ncbi:MAG: TetR/AcrR family transcriptional regulator [Gemmatimonadota bacterium]